MSIDTGEITQQITTALQKVLGSGWGKIKDFSEKQAARISEQAAMIASARIDKRSQLHHNDDLFQWFIQGLKETADNFARSLAALTLLTLEQAWNAVVGVVWGFINKALQSAGLGILTIPTSFVK